MKSQRRSDDCKHLKVKSRVTPFFDPPVRCLLSTCCVGRCSWRWECISEPDSHRPCPHGAHFPSRWGRETPNMSRVYSVSEGINIMKKMGRDDNLDGVLKGLGRPFLRDDIGANRANHKQEPVVNPGNEALQAGADPGAGAKGLCACGTERPVCTKASY